MTREGKIQVILFTYKKTVINRFNDNGLEDREISKSLNFLAEQFKMYLEYRTKDELDNDIRWIGYGNPRLNFQVYHAYNEGKIREKLTEQLKWQKDWWDVMELIR